MIGVVEKTELGDGDNYHRTTLRLSTDYRALKYVQVIHNRASGLNRNAESETLWSGLGK